MSERARQFLDKWEADHIAAVPDVQRLREAVLLATQCRKDAVEAGIPPDEIRAAVRGDLIRHMLAVLADAAHEVSASAALIAS